MARPAIRFGFAAVLLLGDTSLYADGTPKRLDGSASMERIASHIVVGELVGYRRIGDAVDTPGQHTMDRYEAEIRVETVEKGRGIRAGERMAVGFSSHWPILKLADVRVTSQGCGGDYSVPPIPGETARIYLTRTPGGEFVADFDTSFFSIGNFRDSEGRLLRPKAPESSALPASSALPGLIVVVVSVLGVAVPFAVVHRRRSWRKAKIVPATDSIGPLGDFLQSGHNGGP
jgi:hypothetical protein